ncbi:hypothetical protein MAR_004632 [Mya arenaria]|uniref:Uncharacterized protein n=1 Tax=Mya arenaria TaxID=6604 RepID=A0ABY7EX52_MYAAR|nr:hypothetical protein MAR_004632 [Mya arenaria]
MRLNFNLGGFVEVALPFSKNRKLFVAEVIDVQEDEVLFRYMEAARGGFKWPTVEDVSWEHHSSVTRHLDNPVLDIQKSSNHVQIFKMAATLFVQPLDLVKNRMQLSGYQLDLEDELNFFGFELTEIEVAGTSKIGDDIKSDDTNTLDKNMDANCSICETGVGGRSEPQNADNNNCSNN